MQTKIRKIFHKLDDKKENKAFQMLNYADNKMQTAIIKGKLDKARKFMYRREIIADWIVSRSLRLVFKVSEEYSKLNKKHENDHRVVHGVKLGRILSDGNIGLIHSVDNYHTGHNIRFSEYAKRRIRRSMMISLLKNEESHTIDSDLVKLVWRIFRYNELYKENKNEYPTLNLIIEEIKKDKEIKNIIDNADEEMLESYKLLGYLTQPKYKMRKIILDKNIYEIITDALLKFNLKSRNILLEKFSLVSDKGIVNEELSEIHGFTEVEIKDLVNSAILDMETQIMQFLVIE